MVLHVLGGRIIQRPDHIIVPVEFLNSSPFPAAGVHVRIFHRTRTNQIAVWQQVSRLARGYLLDVHEWTIVPIIDQIGVKRLFRRQQSVAHERPREFIKSPTSVWARFTFVLRGEVVTVKVDDIAGVVIIAMGGDVVDAVDAPVVFGFLIIVVNIVGTFEVTDVVSEVHSCCR